jgi:hypothetical protein
MDDRINDSDGGRADTGQEDRELKHLWDIYVAGKKKGYFISVRALWALGLMASGLVVGALFVEDDHAWAAVCVVVQELDDAADDVMDALGIQWD